jgi:FMN phosphatase YigB (HAD superfamily)
MASKHAQGQKQMRASEFAPRKLVIFDIDDTLVHTQTKVHVVKDGHITKELNSHEFTHYKLQPGEHFDFENFRNAKEFFNNSKPIIPMMNQLKHDIATGNKVVMVTARADFDDKELFLDTFRKYGVDMNKVHVYRAGNMTQKVQTEEKKKIIIRNLLNQSHYTKAIMYDDAVPNLDSFVSLKKEYPDTKFYAWHVSLDGVASEYGRTNEASDHMLSEEQPEVRPHRVTDKELVQLLGKGKTDSMLRHPWFQKYSSYEKAYRYARDRWGFVTVDMFPYMTSVNKTANGSIRPTIWVSFVFSSTGRKVVQAHQFRRGQEPDEFEKHNPVTGGWKHSDTWKAEKKDTVK